MLLLTLGAGRAEAELVMIKVGHGRPTGCWVIPESVVRSARRNPQLLRHKIITAYRPVPIPRQVPISVRRAAYIFPDCNDALSLTGGRQVTAWSREFIVTCP